METSFSSSSLGSSSSSPYITDSSVSKVPFHDHPLATHHPFSEMAAVIQQYFPLDDIMMTQALYENQSLKVIYFREEILSNELILKKGAAMQVYLSKSSYYTNDLKRDPLYFRENYLDDYTSECIIPLLNDKIVLGTLHILRKEGGPFGEEDLHPLEKFLSEKKSLLTNLSIYLVARELNQILQQKMAERKALEKRFSYPKHFYHIDTQMVADEGWPGESLPYRNFLDQMMMASEKNEGLVFQGEVGTGKEFFAKKLHYASKKDPRKFVVIDCESLSFWDNQREDYYFCPLREVFEGARGGTLFLKEVGSLNLRLQKLLLGLMQEEIHLNKSGLESVRIISSTSHDLYQLLAEKKIHDQFFHKLLAIQVKIPSLRERKEDIPLLVEYFLHKRDGKNKYQIDKKIHQLFSEYQWNGNTTELKNVVNQIVLKNHTTTVHLSQLPQLFLEQQKERLNQIEDVMTLANLEKNYIYKVLDRTDGNKTHAARLLGITVKTLYNKLNAYGMVSA
jgi:DNA-binding NtrC family response regulator